MTVTDFIGNTSLKSEMFKSKFKRIVFLKYGIFTINGVILGVLDGSVAVQWPFLIGLPHHQTEGGK